MRALGKQDTREGEVKGGWIEGRTGSTPVSPAIDEIEEGVGRRVDEGVYERGKESRSAFSRIMEDFSGLGRCGKYRSGPRGEARMSGH